MATATSNPPFGPATSTNIHTATPPSSVAFQPHEDHDQGTGATDVFQSIAAAPQYCHWSFEELRLADIEHGFAIITHPSKRFPTFESNLVSATVRQPLSLDHKRKWTYACLTKSVRHFGTEVVHFRIGQGEGQQDFTIHQNLITPVSSFVSLAISKGWKESQERTISFPDDDAEVFSLFQEWLYTHRLDTDVTTSKSRSIERYALLVRAYILGDKLGVTDFKDCVIDVIILNLSYSRLFDSHLAHFVYENTMEDSPLRKLWQDIYVWAGNPLWQEEKHLGRVANAEFTLDLSRYRMRMWYGPGSDKPQSPPYEGPALGGCTYHVHEPTTQCYRRRLFWEGQVA